MDTLQKLVEIIRKNSPESLKVAAQPNTCWLDGDSCPYGQPYGQFQHRPRVFCVIPDDQGSGCNKLLNNAEELDYMSRGSVGEEVERRIKGMVDEKSVTLDSELRAIADELENVDKETLVLAADIIEKIRPHDKIVRTEDL